MNKLDRIFDVVFTFWMFVIFAFGSFLTLKVVLMIICEAFFCGNGPICETFICTPGS